MKKIHGIPAGQSSRRLNLGARSRIAGWCAGLLRRVGERTAPLASDQRGNVTIICAFSMAGLLGFAALGLEYGHGLLTKVQDQRAADYASFAAAVVYTSTTSTTSAGNAATNVAALNGIPGASATFAFSGSPSGNGNQAAQVTIVTSQRLLLSQPLERIVSSAVTALPVGSTAFSEINGNAPACIIALDSSKTGVTLTGGSAISAPACAVASNSNVSVPCGTSITTKTVDYNGSVTQSGCTGIKPPAGTPTVTFLKVSTVDPLLGNSEIGAATSRVSKLATDATFEPAPSAPAAHSITATSGGSDMTLGYYPTSISNVDGCSGTLGSGNVWNITCSGSSPFNFGNISIQGGLSVNFDIAGTNKVYNFNGTINNSGNALTFGSGTFTFVQQFSTGSGPTTFGSGTFNFVKGLTTASGAVTFGAGTFNITQNLVTGNGVTSFGASSTSNTFNIGGSINTSSSTATFGGGTFNIGQGVITNGGTTTTFGAGTFNIGANPNSCGGDTKYSICHSGSTLTFGGPSNFSLAGGIYNSGGETLVLGSGTTNSFNVGRSGTGLNSLNMGGGAKTTFADATGNGSVFQMAGNMNIGAGGGSCLTISAATQHDIRGSMIFTGGVTLGAGVYSVTGYVSIGNGSGGDVTCNGSTVGVNGNNVTFIIGGGTLPNSGSCSGYAFCVGSGYGHVTLTAPTTGLTPGLVVVGPVSGITAGANFAEGASNTSISGVFYFPTGPITMSGAATIGNGSGQCLELIGSLVALTGGTAAGTTCTTLTGNNTAGATITLVQ